MSGQGKPPFVSRVVPKYAGFILLPASKLLKPVPIRVWAYEASDGWHGWLETQRRPGVAKVLPSFWAKSNWKATTEANAKKAIAKVTAEAEAKRTAETAAAQTEVQPARKRGQQAQPVVASKAKPGPVKATAKAPEPQPEPPKPTGTDPGKGTDPSDPVAALESVVATLGPNEALKAMAKALQLTGPGVRKAAAKPAAVPARKRAGGKR